MTDDNTRMAELLHRQHDTFRPTLPGPAWHRITPWRTKTSWKHSSPDAPPRRSTSTRLPAHTTFGSVGPSGMGACHAIEGFRTMSHAKGVFVQGCWNLPGLLHAPFGKLVELAISFTSGNNKAPSP